MCGTTQAAALGIASTSCIAHALPCKVEAAFAYRLLKIAAWVSASRSPARRSCCCLACSRASQPAAGEVKFHAGEAANAFKMTHLRMGHSSRDRSTRYQDDFQDCWVSAHHGGSNRPKTMIVVGGRHGCQSVGKAYFRHTFEALIAKFRVTSRRQNSLG